MTGATPFQCPCCASDEEVEGEDEQQPGSPCNDGDDRHEPGHPPPMEPLLLSGGGLLGGSRADCGGLRPGSGCCAACNGGGPGSVCSRHSAEVAWVAAGEAAAAAAAADVAAGAAAGLRRRTAVGPDEPCCSSGAGPQGRSPLASPRGTEARKGSAALAGSSSSASLSTTITTLSTPSTSLELDEQTGAKTPRARTRRPRFEITTDR